MSVRNTECSVSEYLSLEDIANERGESPFKVARALTRKECILLPFKTLAKALRFKLNEQN